MRRRIHRFPLPAFSASGVSDKISSLGVGVFMFRRILKISTMRAVVVGSLAVFGSSHAPVVSTAYAETQSESFDTIFKFKFLPELQKIPSLARIFRDHPEVEAEFRAKARAA